MACECEASNGGCLCHFAAGLSVTITGGGTPADPITISVDPAYLEGVGGTNTLVTVTGTGDVQDPYLVRVDIEPALLAGHWTRWLGSRADLTAIGGAAHGVLAVVVPGA